jgi:hypothetical protein
MNYQAVLTDSIHGGYSFDNPPKKQKTDIVASVADSDVEHERSRIQHQLSEGNYDKKRAELDLAKQAASIRTTGEKNLAQAAKKAKAKSAASRSSPRSPN